jgi:D-alanine--poly(phosphoribitol) ligase subunit 1
MSSIPRLMSLQVLIFLNIKVRILNSIINLSIEEGEIGEICVSGSLLADGYVNGREPLAFATNSFSDDIFFKRLYHTGDYGYVRDGLLHFEGREDSQIKVHGNRVDLEEISAVVNKLEYVHESVTCSFHPSLPDQTIVTFIVVIVNNDLKIEKDPAAIVNDLSELLVDFMVPKVFIVDEIPRLINGTVNKQELLHQYEDSLPKEEVN